MGPSQCVHWTVLPFITAGIILRVEQAVCTLESVALHNRWAYIVCDTGSIYTGQCWLTQQVRLYCVRYRQFVQ